MVTTERLLLVFYVRDEPAHERCERRRSQREPLVTLFQLLESPVPQPDGSTQIIPRPTVDAAVFAPQNRTRLTLLGFSQDVLVPSSTLGDLYTYLTGQPEEAGYRHVVADDAVHNAFTSHPKLITAALKR